MTSFPASLKSVFGGITGDFASPPQRFLRSLPLLKLAPTPRAERPTPALAKIIECDIIPRLKQAHPCALPPIGPTIEAEVSREIPLGAETTESFARRVLCEASPSLAAFIDTLLRGGVDGDAIYADLLAPTARLLTDWWAEDLVSYTEVTIGLGRLQQLVRTLGGPASYNGASDQTARSILFTPRPEDRHSFEFYIMEELFRWSGWRTWIETSSTLIELGANVRRRWYDVLCLSVARETELDDAAAMIDAVRRDSRNGDVFVLVNGRPFIERPELVGAVGAHAAATNGAAALRFAENAIGGTPIQ